MATTLTTLATDLGRRARVGARAVLVTGLALLATALCTSPALAATYRTPNTVHNFCSFNRGLGTVYTGRSQGIDYALWDIADGGRFNYIAFDTNGDGHVDAVAYIPYVDGEYQVTDLGFCAGSGSGVWYSAAAIEQEQEQGYEQGRAAENAAWAEMLPSISFNGEMNALLDADW
jgi:hypothetical protein